MGAWSAGAMGVGELSGGARLILLLVAVFLVARLPGLRLALGLLLVAASLVVALTALLQRPGDLELVMDGAIAGTAVGTVLICVGTQQGATRSAERRERARERAGEGWASRR